MRTTLTLDGDVADKLKSRARRTGRPFKDVVNEALRLGLAATSSRPVRTPFVAKVRDLGRVSPGLDLDNVADVLERVEGSGHR